MRKLNVGDARNPNDSEYITLPDTSVTGLAQGTLYAFTDGSCHPNPGPGGWGVRLIWGTTAKELYGGSPDQTNNTMEIEAIRQALGARRSLAAPMVIYSDSQYSIKALTQWHHGWRKNNWLTSAGKPVKNVDLIMDTLRLITANVTFKWVKGHAGHEHNERVDDLAKEGRLAYGGST